MENIVKEAIKKLIELSPIVKNCYELGNEQRILLADKSWIIRLKTKSHQKIADTIQSLHPFKSYLIDAEYMGEKEFSKASSCAQKLREQTHEESIIISPQEIAVKEDSQKDFLLVSDEFCHDILDELVKGQTGKYPSSFGNILNSWVMKRYRQIWIYGDTLMSGVYAAYAASEIKKNYGKYPLILLFHDNDIRGMANVDINSELLRKLGIPVFSKITESDIYEMPEQSLFITPQHRLLYTQKIVEGSDTDIYTIPEQEVIIKDDNLALYYVDMAIQELSKQKGHASCLRLWKKAKAEHNFNSKLQQDILVELSETIVSLVKEHKPRLDEFYGY